MPTFAAVHNGKMFEFFCKFRRDSFVAARVGAYVV
jgi:hypothetical protein